jgi:NitT/TauT family transport system ATP-binding protein
MSVYLNPDGVASGPDADDGAYIVLEGVCKGFPATPQHPEPKTVYNGLDLTVRKGEVMGCMGPNAVGKTVLCNMLCDKCPPDAGTIRIGGMPPGHIRTGYVYQNYREAMFPWRNVLDNICLGLEFAHVPKAERHAAADRLLKRLGIEIDLRAFPYELSGGQQQMVALLRAMLIEPELLLMDEPFQSLDLEHQLILEDVLLRTLGERSTTAVIVSHDPADVVLLADRVAVLSRRPPHVAGVVEVDLPRPREVVRTPSDPHFSELVTQVRVLFEEARRQW